MDLVVDLNEFLAVYIIIAVVTVEVLTTTSHVAMDTTKRKGKASL